MKPNHYAQNYVNYKQIMLVIMSLPPVRKKNSLKSVFINIYISLERKINFLFFKELRALTEMSELLDRPF